MQNPIDYLARSKLLGNPPLTARSVGIIAPTGDLVSGGGMIIWGPSKDSPWGSAEWIEAPEEFDPYERKGTERWQIYQFDLDPRDPAHDWVDYPGIASYTGVPLHGLIEAVKQIEHVGARAEIYYNIISFHGVYELDQYPTERTYAEMMRRVGPIERAEQRRRYPSTR